MQLIRNIITFFGNLLPKFSKSDIETEFTASLSVNRQLYREGLMQVDNAVGSANRLYTNLLRALNADVKTFKVGDNPYEVLRRVCYRLDKESEDTLRFLDVMLNETIIREAMDYSRLNLVQYVGAIRFFNTYTMRFLTLMVSVERGAQMSAIDRVNYDWCVKNISVFTRVVSSLIMPIQDIRTSIEKLKGVAIDPDITETAMGLRPGATDVMGFGFLPTFLNPYLLIGLKINEWTDDTHEENVRTIERIEFELMALNMEKNNATKEQKASIEKQIAYNSTRLSVLRAKIQDYEDEVLNK